MFLLRSTPRQQCVCPPERPGETVKRRQQQMPLCCVVVTAILTQDNQCSLQARPDNYCVLRNNQRKVIETFFGWMRCDLWKILNAADMPMSNTSDPHSKGNILNSTSVNPRSNQVWYVLPVMYITESNKWWEITTSSDRKPLTYGVSRRRRTRADWRGCSYCLAH